MADTKITALTAITTVDPAVDVLPIVDVSDTTMAASGTTKKITSNQILGAGGTATLASATITGDLTAARLIVTGGTIPTNGLWLPTTNTLEFAANSLAQYRIAPLGVFSWYDGAGGTRMTLNANGLGIGVTPSAQLASYKSFQFGIGGNLIGRSDNSGIELSSNSYRNSGGNYIYLNTATAASYRQYSGGHEWHNAPSGTAGNAITFTQAMTLDASGNLLVGKTASSTTVAGSQVQPDGTHSAVKSDGNPGFFYNTTTAISGTIALFRSNGVTVGSISQDGTNTAYNNSSDYRLKESVQPLTGGLSRVNALKPSIYKWKTNGKVGEGFLAHELAEVVPFAVTGEKDAVTKDGEIEPQQVDLSKVVPILVAAIQELAAEVNALKNA